MAYIKQLEFHIKGTPKADEVFKVTTDNYVPEDKVKIPYQVIEKPVQEGITNTTAVSFNRPYITPADGRTY